MLRWKSRSIFGKAAAIAVGMGLVGSGPAFGQAVINKANNATNLDQGASWVGGVAPTNVDTALWDATVAGANSTLLGSDQAWAGLRITNPGGAVTIGGANVLTLGAGGIDMAGATQSLTLNSNVDLGAAQTWNIASGQSVTSGGVISDISGLLNTLTKRGNGALTLTRANTFTGPTVVQGGTLNLNYAAAGAPSSDILGAANALTVGNSTLNVTGAAGGTNTQNLATLGLGAGFSTINVSNGAGGTMTLNAANIGGFASSNATPNVAQVGAAVRFNGLATDSGITGTPVPVAATGAVLTTNIMSTASAGTATANAIGIVGPMPGNVSIGAASAGYATVGLYDYAGFDGTQITGLSQIAGAYTTTWTLGNINNDLTANVTLANGGAQRASGTVRFNTPTATTITVGTSNLFTNSGFLITPNMGANNTQLNGPASGVWQVIRQTSPNGTQQGTIWQNNTAAFFTVAIPIVNGREGNADPSLISVNGAGTTVFSGSNAHLGGTHVNEGQLMITADNNLGAATAPVVLGAGGTLVGNASFTAGATRPLSVRSGGGGLAATSGNTLTVGGVIADDANGGGLLTVGVRASAANGSVVGRIAGTGAGTANTTAMNATGSVALANANTYTGGTEIVSGTLLATNTTGSATGTGVVTVSSGGGLGGTGIISGIANASSGGHITPGIAGTNTGIGSVTLGGVNFAAGSILDLDMAAAQNDMVASTNGLSVAAGSLVNLFQAGTAGQYMLNGTYNIFNVTSGAIPSAATLQSNFSIANAVGGGTYTWGVSGNLVTLTIAGLSNASTWNVNGGGLWGTATNWNPQAVPNNAGDSATLGNALTAGSASIQLGSVRTVGNLSFNNTNGGSYSVDAAGGSLTLNNGASTAAVSVVAGSHSITAPVTLASNTNVTVTQAADTLAITGNISGAQNMVFMGSGKTILSGSNSYANTQVDVGSTLQVGAGGTTGTLGSGALTVNGTLDVNRSNAVSLGAITGTGAVANSGTGTTTLTGVNTGAFGVTVNGGSLVVGAGSNIGTGAITTNGGSLDLNGTSPTASSIAGTGGTVNNTSATATTLTVNQAGASTFGGTLADTGTGGLQLVKQGLGQLTLTGNTNNDGLLVGTVTSSIRVEDGSVVLNSAGALPAGKTLESRVSGTGVLVGSANVAGNILLHPATNTSAALFDVTAGSAATVSGQITVPATMTSPTQVRINAGNDVNTSLTITGGLNVVNTQVGIFIIERGNFVFAGNSVSTVGPDFNMSRGVGGNHTFTFRDNAQFTGNANLVLAAGGQTSPVTAAYTMQDNAVVTGNNFEVNGSASGSTTVNLNGGTLRINSMTKTAATPTTVGFNGTTIVSRAAGSVIPATLTALTPGTDGAVVKAGGAKFDTNGFDATIDAPLYHDTALAAVADGGLTKSGGGKLTIGATSTNTYAGPTVVNGGTLEMNGTHGFNNEFAPVADYALNAGGRLAGTGTIGDGIEVIDIVVNNGGIVAPGSYSDTLQFPGNLNVNGGSVLFGLGGRMEATVNAGGLSDQLVVTGGSINLTAASNVLKIQAADGITNGTSWTIATAASVTGTFETFTPGYSVTYPGGNSILVTRTGNSADFDFDGDIDGSDFLVWQRNLGLTGAVQSAGDANLDGNVNAADLTIWKSQFATGATLLAATAPVPEPAMAILAALAVPALVGAARRRRS